MVCDGRRRGLPFRAVLAQAEAIVEGFAASLVDTLHDVFSLLAVHAQLNGEVGADGRVFPVDKVRRAAHLHVKIDAAARLGQPVRHIGEGCRTRRRRWVWRGALDSLPLDADVFVVRRVDPDKPSGVPGSWRVCGGAVVSRGEVCLDHIPKLLKAVA